MGSGVFFYQEEYNMPGRLSYFDVSSYQGSVSGSINSLEGGKGVNLKPFLFVYQLKIFHKEKFLFI